jgi:hypothetical protein
MMGMMGGLAPPNAVASELSTLTALARLMDPQAGRKSSGSRKICRARTCGRQS